MSVLTVQPQTGKGSALNIDVRIQSSPCEQNTCQFGLFIIGGSCQ